MYHAVVGSSIAKMIFPAAITSNSAADRERCPAVGEFHRLCHEEEGLRRPKLKQRARETYGTTIGFRRDAGEMPSQRGHLLRDRSRTSSINGAFPALRFHFKWSDYELLQAKDMQETFRAIVENHGRRISNPKLPSMASIPSALREGRPKIIHEVGTARMGADPKKPPSSNGFCQAPRREKIFSSTDGRTASHQSRQESHSHDHGPGPGAPSDYLPRRSPRKATSNMLGNVLFFVRHCERSEDRFLSAALLACRKSLFSLRPLCPPRLTLLLFALGRELIDRLHHPPGDILRTLAFGAARRASVLQIIPAEAAEYVHQNGPQGKIS